MVSLAQLLALGLSRAAIEARVKRKRLVALYRGVYAVGHTALTHDGHLVAAVYACGAGALLSHRSAGRKHGLLEWDPARVEVTVLAERRRPGITTHRSRLIRPDDRDEVDGIPVTSVARTLVDLADVLDDRRLTAAVHRAEILRVRPPADRGDARQAPGPQGQASLKRVLANYRPELHVMRSEAERKLKLLCENHALPQPQFNVQLHGYEVDVYWPAADFVLEFDGAQTHYTRHAFHRDRRRDRALAVEGIQTLRVTWPDLDDNLAGQLREILRHR